MIVKNQMKMQKKIVALCIFALTIGIATALPLMYFTNIKTNSTTQTEPWLDATILYANSFQSSKDHAVNVVANFTLTPELINLNDVDAKIEVYKFHVYSDQGPITNMIYTFETSQDIPDPKAPNGVTKAIRRWNNGDWVFADNTSYNLTDVIGPIDGGSMRVLDPLRDNRFIEEGWAFITVSSFLSADKGERHVQALINLENAQTIYINITRVMTVTYKHQINSDSSIASTTNTLTHNKVLSHIELSKTDFGFASGPVPDFMQNSDEHNTGKNGYAWWTPLLPPTGFLIVQPTVQIDKQMDLYPKIVK